LQLREMENTAFATDLKMATARPEIDADSRATARTLCGFDRCEVVVEAYPLQDVVDLGHQFHRGDLRAA
jgi:hypothetical protein